MENVLIVYLLVQQSKFYLLKLYILALFCKQIFILQLKSKHDYHKNDNILLLMTFKSGFKIFQIHMSRRKYLLIYGVTRAIVKVLCQI